MEKKERKKEWKLRSPTFFNIIFKERKKRKKEERKTERKKEKNNVICVLPHRNGKEKKADKLSRKEVNVITESQLQLLSPLA